MSPKATEGGAVPPTWNIFVQRGEPYVAPLCPAGHLPHKGGDWPSSRLSPIDAGKAPHLPPRRIRKANSSGRGGDVAEGDRGGRDVRCNCRIVPLPHRSPPP